MSNPNRNKALLGFGAILAVTIVAILFLHSNVTKDNVTKENVTKEDAPGAIGAVQKHHAPQIAQQDVILGDESSKRQQQLISTDYLADAAKLRSFSASRDVAAARLFSQELETRYKQAAGEASGAASRLSARQAADIAQAASRFTYSSRVSTDDMQAFHRLVADVPELYDEPEAMLRLAETSQSLATINLADDQLASKISDFERALSRVDDTIELASLKQYLGMMEMESRLVANDDVAQRTAEEFDLAAQQLEAHAQLNVAEAAAREQTLSRQLSAVLNEVQAAENRATQARMVNNVEMSAKLGQLAQRLNQRQAASEEIMAMRAQRSLDARSQ
jgi:hypothetical protein